MLQGMTKPLLHRVCLLLGPSLLLALPELQPDCRLAASWAAHSSWPPQPHWAAPWGPMWLPLDPTMACRQSCGKHHVIMAESYYEETTESGCGTCHKGDHPSGPSVAPPSKGTKAPMGTPAPTTTQVSATTAAPATATGEPTTAAPTPGVACVRCSPSIDRLSTCHQCHGSLQPQSQLLPAHAVVSAAAQPLQPCCQHTCQLAQLPCRLTSIKLCSWLT